MTYTEEQLKHRNEIYNDAEEVLNKMIRVIEKIRNGEFESAACRQEGIDNLRFRNFIRSNWVCDNKEKKYNYDTIPYSWQENFIKDVYKSSDISLIDFDRAYEYVLSTLSDKEQKIIRLRYEEELTLEEIGEEMNICRERARQILARTVRRLNVKDRKIVFDKGVDYIEAVKELRDYERQYNDRINEVRKVKAQTDAIKNKLNKGISEEDINIANKPIKIDEIGLSVRSYNCLRRSGIIYLNDLSGYKNEDFYKIRNLGRKSVDEIVSLCKEYGIRLQCS